MIERRDRTRLPRRALRPRQLAALHRERLRRPFRPRADRQEPAGWLQKLGGPAAFGAALTQAEVARLAAAYSERAVRLHPHPRRQARLVNAFVTAGAGFLLAVLWFDLMFDVQAAGHAARLPEPVLASIAAYYAARHHGRAPDEPAGGRGHGGDARRARRRDRRSGEPGWVGWVSLALALAAIGLAGVQTVPAPSGSAAAATRRRCRAVSRARSSPSTCSALRRSRP